MPILALAGFWEPCSRSALGLAGLPLMCVIVEGFVVYLILTAFEFASKQNTKYSFICFEAKRSH